MPMLDADASTFRVIEEMKRIYKSKILPLEKLYHFEEFYSPSWTDEEFDSKPQILILGMYSVGKTSFIKYLVGRDLPGSKIGPEPTTDKFTVIMHGRDERVIPGNTLALKKDLPYRGLERFGVQFLNKFEGSQVNSEALRNVHMIDTPGVLSGEKQTTGRGYNFQEVVGWFAQRVDMIVLMFDTLKLDFCDEFKDIVRSLGGYSDKIRCVLNKADQVDKQRLLRTYGAVMWNLGKIINTPEVPYLYVGSFWDQPAPFDENVPLLQAEQRDLMKAIRDLPRNAAQQRIAVLVKRIRLVKVHSYLIGYLKDQMPTFGKQKKMHMLCDTLQDVFESVQSRYNLHGGDFPDLEEVRSKLREKDMSKFSSLKLQLIDQLDGILERDIPRLTEALPGSTGGIDEGDGSNQLLALLDSGLHVIKHGRKGGPKERLLRCNAAVTRLYWSSDFRAKELPDESKSIALREVIEIRRGTDPDPDHPGLFGTENLRRHSLKDYELECCVSLILRSRTLDIQCRTSDEFLSLFSNLQRQCLALKNAIKPPMTGAMAAMGK